MDKASFHFLTFSEKSINYVSQLFSDNGSIKKWHELKREYNLHESSHFKWLQLEDSYNIYMRPFQYKILNHVLCLNKKLHAIGIKPSPLCSFCNLYDETPLHMFDESDAVKCLWTDLVQCFQNNFKLPTLTPQAAILGILESANNDSIIKNNKVFINHILLIFKLYIVIFLIAEIRKVKRIGKEIILTNSMKAFAFTKKWLVINNIVP